MDGTTEDSPPGALAIDAEIMREIKAEVRAELTAELHAHAEHVLSEAEILAARRKLRIHVIFIVAVCCTSCMFITMQFGVIQGTATISGMTLLQEVIDRLFRA